MFRSALLAGAGHGHATVVPAPTTDHAIASEVDGEPSSKAAQTPLQHSILEILRLCDMVRRARFGRLYAAVGSTAAYRPCCQASWLG